MKKISKIGCGVIVALIAAAGVWLVFEKIAANKATLVDSGFVFIEGKYLAPPYRLEIQGNVLLLNGHVVKEIKSRKVKKIIPSTDMKIPDWVTEDTKWAEILCDADGGSLGLYRQKWFYAKQHYPPRQAIEKMETFLRSLPCVKKVERDTPIKKDSFRMVLKVTSNENKVVFLALGGPDEDKFLHNPVTPEEAARQLREEKKKTQKRLESKKALIEKLLLHDNAIFFYRKAMRHSLGSTLVSRYIPTLIEVMESDRPREDKLELAGLLGGGPSPQYFVDGYEHSEPLMERLDKLRQESGIQPIPVEKVKDTLSPEAILKRVQEDCPVLI